MPPIPFVDFAHEIRSLYKPPLKRKATYTKAVQVLDELALLGIQSTAELTPATIARFVTAHPNRSFATKRGLLSYLRALVNHAVWADYVPRSPFGGRGNRYLQGAVAPKRRHHSAEEIASVLRTCAQSIFEWKSHRTYALVSVLAYTGMRRNEALHLRTEDLDADAGLIAIVPSRANPLKTSCSAALVPAPALLTEVLQRWCRRSGSEWLFPNLDGRNPWTGGAPGRRAADAVKAAGSAAGVEGLTPLSLRHSFATIAVNFGLSPLEIAQCLRHSNTRTQEAYRHTESRSLARKLQHFNFEETEWQPTSPPRNDNWRVKRRPV